MKNCIFAWYILLSSTFSMYSMESSGPITISTLSNSYKKLRELYNNNSNNDEKAECSSFTSDITLQDEINQYHTMCSIAHKKNPLICSKEMITYLQSEHRLDINRYKHVSKQKNSHSCTIFYKNPLVEACKAGNSTFAGILIDCGANVDVIIDQEDSPLIHAVRENKPECITLLLSRGADVNLRMPSTNATALFWAVAQGNEAVTAQLLHDGARLDRIQDIHQTLYSTHETRQVTIKNANDLADFSMQLGHHHIAQLLKVQGAQLSLKNRCLSTFLENRPHIFAAGALAAAAGFAYFNPLEIEGVASSFGLLPLVMSYFNATNEPQNR